MLFIFLAYHLHLIKIGCSTNEKIKLSQLRYFLRRSVAFLEKWVQIKEKDDDFEPADKCIEQYSIEKDWDLARI